MIAIWIIAYLIGVIVAYYLTRLDFKQEGWGWTEVINIAIASFLFSWLLVIASLISNLAHGNFGKINGKPPKWL